MTPEIEHEACCIPPRSDADTPVRKLVATADRGFPFFAQAHVLMRLLALRNDVGLLSEEYDPDQRRLVGNFPQAFSHISLINTAHNLVNRQPPTPIAQ